MVLKLGIGNVTKHQSVGWLGQNFQVPPKPSVTKFPFQTYSVETGLRQKLTKNMVEQYLRIWVVGLMPSRLQITTEVLTTKGEGCYYFDQKDWF